MNMPGVILGKLNGPPGWCVARAPPLAKILHVLPGVGLGNIVGSSSMVVGVMGPLVALVPATTNPLPI